ncbi:DUF3103 family protein [Streptomyces polygonati]|uniref:DUF3103 family protein n=1 Tax=Streptomyces polygonati TaxID=1617087 RepID=A0ABV8HR22_9ACTN
MHLTPIRRGALAVSLCAVTALAFQGLASATASASAPVAPVSSVSSAAAGHSAVGGIETGVARRLAASLADPSWRAQVRGAALGSRQVALGALTARAAAPGGLGPSVAAADRGITAAKGLAADSGSLLVLRLGADSMRPALTPGAVPLVAAATGADSAATVTAYDSSGRAHTLSAREVPRQPVYVVDIDVSKAMSAGLAQIDRQLARAGLTTAASPPAARKPAARPDAESGTKSGASPAVAGFWTTRVDSVYLNDDEEPWVLGDAEIYSIVSGFGFDGKVRVDTVDMPYLDDDHTTYYPNQILVNWSNYKYDLADVVMMEDDGDTNYAALAKALADALLTITDQGAYVPLVDAILAAIPSSWYTNDDDYVDSWYTLAQPSAGRLNGARGNGWMTVDPYFVAQL